MSAEGNNPVWQRAEGLLLAFVAIACLIFQIWLPSTHVSDADYLAVAQVLEQERQPDDVVLLAPWWTERARIFVPNGLPVVGYQGSDADPLDRYARIWVLSQPHLPRAGIDAFEAQFTPARTSLGPARTFGNLSLQLFRNERHRIVRFDSADLLPQAQVFMDTAGGERKLCAWTGTAHRCANGRTVATEWHEVHFAPYRCVRLEAPGGNNRVGFEFSAPAAQHSTLWAGYIWEYGAHREGITPSTVTLEVEGQPSQSLELKVGDEHMHRIDGPAIAAGARVRVTLQSQNPASRVVCTVLTGSDEVTP